MEKKETGVDKELIRALRSIDPKDYVKYWIDDNHLEYTRGGLWRYNTATLRYDELRNKLLIDYHIDRSKASKRLAKLDEDPTEPVSRLPKKLSKDVLFAASDEVMRQIKHAKLTALRMAVAFDPKADPEGKQLAAFVKNLTTQNVELSIAVMGHYIHMTKSRLFDKQVENHVLPVIIGAQGKGKSDNLNRFLAPFKDYRLNLPEVGSLTDPRNFHAFADNYVGLIDEMPRLNKADMNKVKSIVTMPVLSSRTLGTNIFTNVPNNLTIIGTSNTRLKHQHIDTTGMRRFYELIVDKEISREISENIDYVKLWQSIDENSPSPILDYLPQLREHQEDMRPRDYIEQFFEENHINLSKPLELKIEVRDVMYNAIKQWAKITGNEGPWLREQTMKNMLEEHGLKQHITNGKKFYKVNTDCMLNTLYANGFSDNMLTESEVDEIESLPQLQKMLEAAVKKEDYTIAARIKEKMRAIKSKISKGDVFNL